MQTPGSSNENFANNESSQSADARNSSAELRTATTTREVQADHANHVSTFAFQLGWRCAQLMHKLRRAYVTRRLPQQSRSSSVPPPATSSSKPASPREASRSATARVLWAYGSRLAAVVMASLIAFAAAMLWAVDDPSLEPHVDGTSRPLLVLEAANGAPLGQIGPLKLADITRQDLPDHLVHAVLSVEDRRFYDHFGIDPFGILRAARRNLSVGEIVEGGSTITQQLVKMLYLGNERTFARKFREALMAIFVDLRLPKDEILTRYFNALYLGSGAHGIAAAARLYFNKEVAELTLPESAMLAGLIRAPSQYSPLRDLTLARARAAVVLDAMVENGAIDERMAASSKAHPAVLKSTAAFAPAKSWFADWIAQESTQVAGPSTHSIRVRTTLDLNLQALAEKIVEETLAKEGRRVRASQAALVAMRPDGAVIAMVGGRAYRTSRFNRATEANRHPGSAFKVFVYLAALRKGYSPDDLIDAGPVTIKNWRPENFGGAQYRHVTLADAFARSINTAAVRLALDVGLKDVIQTARDLGIDARMQPVPSLALGAVGVSPLDLTGAFASLRSGRTGLQPWGIATLGDEQEQSMHTGRPPVARSVQSLGSVHQPMMEMLHRVVEHGTGRAASIGGFVGGKTGTSQNHRDAWFIGFTNSLIVGVWVGNDDNTPMRGVVGGTLPASIWRQFVRGATPLLESDAAQIGSYDTPTIQTSAETSAAACDIQACAGRYRSFRASDCTYQSYSGERRLCQAGHVAIASATSEQNVGERAPASNDEATTAFAHARCNVNVCARRYRSFSETDCTYQPHGGGRRQICEAGEIGRTTTPPNHAGAQRAFAERRQNGWGSYGWPGRRKERAYGWRW